MRNTICATLTAITLVLCTALAGCGSASGPSTPAHAVRSVDSQCSAGADVFTECVITLTDTRQVDCIVYSTNGKQAGLSCDWSHVSGADKEPARWSYNVVTTEGIRTFENIDDAGDYAQAMSLRTGEPAKVFHAETGLVAFTVRPTTKDTK